MSSRDSKFAACTFFSSWGAFFGVDFLGPAANFSAFLSSALLFLRRVSSSRLFLSFSFYLAFSCSFCFLIAIYFWACSLRACSLSSEVWHSDCSFSLSAFNSLILASFRFLRASLGSSSSEEDDEEENEEEEELEPEEKELLLLLLDEEDLFLLGVAFLAGAAFAFLVGENF